MGADELLWSGVKKKKEEDRPVLIAIVLAKVKISIMMDEVHSHQCIQLLV